VPGAFDDTSQSQPMEPSVAMSESEGEQPASAGDDTPELPAELLYVSWLIGSWSGVGLGQYPTIDDFRFQQDLVIATDGRPFLTITSRSWLLDAEGQRIRQSASEVGYLRPQPNNEVELLLVHPTGINETWFGQVEITGMVNSVITGARMSVTTDGIMRTPSAKEVNSGERLYGLVEGDLLWTYDMAAMGKPMSNHLSARLRPA
jgi:hypothetical protein